MLPSPPADIPASPSAVLLGWRLVAQDAAKGWVRIAFEAKREFLNPASFVQGGFLSAMLDDSMGLALWIMTKDDFYPATIAMTVCFLAPAMPGPLFGEGQVVRYGHTIAFLEGRLTDAPGQVVARATASARLVPAKRAVDERCRPAVSVPDLEHAPGRQSAFRSAVPAAAAAARRFSAGPQ